MRILGIIALALWLAGCSSNDAITPPSPLPEFTASIQVEKLWDYDIDDGVDDHYLALLPAITEAGVYVASYSGELAKLDAVEGDEQWQIDTEQRITGGVAAGYGMVVYGTADGEAVARNAADGAELWKTRLSGQVLSVPAMGAERVIFQTYDGRLHALERETGKVAWVFDTPVPALTLRGESSPLQIGNIVLAGFANGKLIALDTKAGFVGWERAISEPSGRSELERLNDLDGRFWLSGQQVYAVNYQGRLMALDVRTGQPLWQKPLSSYAGVSEYLDQLYVVDAESRVMGLDAGDGRELWQQEQLLGRRLGAPLAFDDYVIAGDFEGYLHWMSYKSGEFLARVRVDSDGLRAAPQRLGDTVYVQGNSGRVAAYRVLKEDATTDSEDQEAP